MIGRRELITLLGGAAAAWPLAARAQQQDTKVWRIGVLETVSKAQNAANFDAFQRGLRERGYVEGQNYVVEYRSADGRSDSFVDLAAELVRLPADIIITRGTPAARAAKQATEKIPVVMAAIGEPLGVGVVASLAKPGGNITGFSAFVTELSGKRVEILKEAFPNIARVGFLNNMSNPVIPPQWDETKRAAIDGVTQANAHTIIDQVARMKIPAVYASREFVDVGGLMTYSPSYPHLYYRAAGVVDKIFKGARPGDLPVEQPTKLELVINLKTAKSMGFALPPVLLARADEVIE